MIIKTAQNPNAGALFRHLTRLDYNERVDVAQLRGVVAEGFQEALAEMEAVACGTQCEKNFYHVSVAIQDHEQLKREQWLDVAERIGQEFGIEDHARAVVFHVKGGKEHIANLPVCPELGSTYWPNLIYIRHGYCAEKLTV